MSIPIVVVAFDRHNCLARLLNSLLKAEYENNNDIELIISIDKNDNLRTYQIAEDFYWPFGKKTIIKYDQNLGLKKHIIKCGDIALDNEAVIILEDDLYLSKSFYKYAIETVNFYSKDKNIAGISLYNYRISEFANLRPFVPIQDESDTYFIQVPSSWGQIWTKNQWTNFKKWYENMEYMKFNYKGIIPDTVLNWKDSSWKKYFHMYMVSNNKYFVYPRVSLSTNMADSGTHNKFNTNKHQAMLMGEYKKNYYFRSLNKSECIYDAFFESTNVKNYIKDIVLKEEVIIDYYGLKEKYNKEGYLLSIKELNYKIIDEWQLSLVPYEMNIINGINGKGIYLYDLSTIKKNKNNSFKTYNIKYEIPSMTKEKAAYVTIFDYMQAIKRKVVDIFIKNNT